MPSLTPKKKKTLSLSLPQLYFHFLILRNCKTHTHKKVTFSLLVVMIVSGSSVV